MDSRVTHGYDDRKESDGYDDRGLSNSSILNHHNPKLVLAIRGWILLLSQFSTRVSIS